MLSAATLAAVAAVSGRTTIGGHYDLQRPTEKAGVFGDVDEFETVAPGVAIRVAPLIVDTAEQEEGEGTGEKRGYRVAFPASLSPAPRSGWRFATPDGRDVLTIEKIEDVLGGGAVVHYAVCGRQEAR